MCIFLCYKGNMRREGGGKNIHANLPVTHKPCSSVLGASVSHKSSLLHGLWNKSCFAARFDHTVS